MDILEFSHYRRGIRRIIWHERFPSQNKASLICIWYADNTYPTYHFNSNILFNVIKARLLSYRWVRNKISSSLLRRLLMELVGHYLMAIVETGGLFAPLLFITFHLLRPLVFLLVIFICISGGILFGAVAGTIYSVIGITLSIIIFYGMIHWMPNTFQKLVKIKEKLAGKYTSMTTPQITLLRLIPFIHFHLLSLFLIEVTVDFKDYTKSSLLSTIPFAVMYTSIGQLISNLPPIYLFAFFVSLLPLIYVLRKKEINIKWHDFFHANA